MDKFLKFLSGKKSTIAAILALTAWYCFAKGYIDDMTFKFIAGVLVILFPTVSYATKLAYKK